MDKILILGGYGMLGTDMYDVLTNSQKFDVIRFSSATLDITDPKALRKAFHTHHPNWIINCAAYTAVDNAEDEPGKAIAINAHAVENIAREAKTIGTKIVHFSTDYVFDGENADGYRENDAKNPLGSYGRSKSIGENLLLETYPEGSYVIRTAWLYGHHGKNFVKTMLRLAAEKPEIQVVNDQTGCPTWTYHLAEAVRDDFILPSLKKFPNTINSQLTAHSSQPAPGIYHLVNSDSCTWYDFACEIMRQARLATKVIPITTEEYPTKAVRPKCSILLNTKLLPLPSWQEGLREYFSTTR